jgi:hypothetical protein
MLRQSRAQHAQRAEPEPEPEPDLRSWCVAVTSQTAAALVNEMYCFDVKALCAVLALLGCSTRSSPPLSSQSASAEPPSEERLTDRPPPIDVQDEVCEGDTLYIEVLDPDLVVLRRLERIAPAFFCVAPFNKDRVQRLCALRNVNGWPGQFCDGSRAKDGLWFQLERLSADPNVWSVHPGHIK